MLAALMQVVKRGAVVIHTWPIPHARHRQHRGLVCGTGGQMVCVCIPCHAMHVPPTPPHTPRVRACQHVPACASMSISVVRCELMPDEARGNRATATCTRDGHAHIRTGEAVRLRLVNEYQGRFRGVPTAERPLEPPSTSHRLVAWVPPPSRSATSVGGGGPLPGPV